MGMRVAVCVVDAFTAFVDPEGSNDMNRICRHTAVPGTPVYPCIMPGTLYCVLRIHF